jgi:hypothetical protein
MKHWSISILITLFMIAMGSVGVFADELPESVQQQSRKDVVESEEWQQFDQSGQVKFLQVQHTAAASPADSGAVLDSSIGERLVEVKVDAAVECDQLVWTLTTEGTSPVWVVAGVKDPVQIDPEASQTVETALADGYSYIVVDNEGGGQTSLDIKAACGEVEAQTVRGKSMLIQWF